MATPAVIRRFEAEMDDLVARMRDAKVTLGTVLDVQRRSAHRQMAPRITLPQLNALYTPSQKQSTQIIEVLTAECMTKRFGWTGHPDGKTHLYLSDVAKRTDRLKNNHVVYADHMKRRQFFDAVNETQVFVNLTNRGAGYDFIYFEGYEHDVAAGIHSVDVHIVQQKIGATPLSTTKSKGSANRSFPIIIEKLDDAAQKIRERLYALYGVKARVLQELHVTSPVPADVCAMADDWSAHCDGVLFDADDVWRNTWTDDVTSVLKNLYGKDKKTLGPLL